MAKKGLVFNIQRYSIHDGGGIRTILFFKGCPLGCPWCSNPESRLKVEPAIWHKNGKEEIIGQWYSVEELVHEVLKDEIFYRTSGGGVTLSGGEILMQSEFARELLKELHYLGIHTAIETTGCYDKARLESLLPYLNQVLFDLKIMDPQQLKKVIYADLQKVKANFELAWGYSPDLEVIPRIPLIPGYTDLPDNLLAIAKYVADFDVKEVHLLPFHQYGSSKYEYLGWEYQLAGVPNLQEDEIEAIRDIFKTQGIRSNVDGLE